MTEQEARWQALIERFAQAADAPTGVGDLVRAINGQRDQSIGCEACRAELPSYVDSEIGGLSIAHKYPQSKRHLAGCTECEAEYMTLLGLALSDEAIPAVVPVSAPDLSFLPPLHLSEYVRVLTERIVARIAPDLIGELSAIADLFFERVAELGDQIKFGTTTVPALGFGAGETPESLRMLAATYAATRASISTETKLQRQPGQLAALLREEAQRAARQMHLNSTQTKRFVEAYVELAGRDADTLQRLAR